MSDEPTQGGPEALDIVATGHTLVTLAGYLHSIYEVLVEAIDTSGDDAVAHKLVLCRATLVRVGAQIDVLGGKLSKSPRHGNFDDMLLD